MSTPKLFEFPTGTVIDLQHVYMISGLYVQGPLESKSYYVRVYFLHSPDQENQFRLSDSQVVAGSERNALIARWAQDK